MTALGTDPGHRLAADTALDHHQTPKPIQSAKRRKRLLHVFPGFGLGGVPIRISNIINHFGGLYEHVIVAMDRCFDSKVRIDPDIAVSYAAPSLSKYGLIRNLWQLRGEIREHQPDLLLTHNWGAVEWALANRIWPACPHIHFESGFGPEESERQIWRRIVMRRLALARTARIVVPSHSLYELSTKVWRLRADRVVHIPNGIDCSLYGEAPRPGEPAGFAKKPGELIVGTLAPLRAVKNLGRLIRCFMAAAADIQARLLILGEGAEREKLTALIRELGAEDRVVLAGHVEAVHAALGWLDIYALSSDTEQMPNSLLQGMAAGLPVASVDVGDVKRMLPEENQCLVVPRDDEAAFADAMRRLLTEPSLRHALGSANKAHVRKLYGQDRMFDTYAALFEGVT